MYLLSPPLPLPLKKKVPYHHYQSLATYIWKQHGNYDLVDQTLRFFGFGSYHVTLLDVMQLRKTTRKLKHAVLLCLFISICAHNTSIYLQHVQHQALAPLICVALVIHYIHCITFHKSTKMKQVYEREG